MKISPDKVTKVIVMRSAGYTISTIANSVRISTSSVKRICQKNNVHAGGALESLVAEARADLTRTLTSDDSIKLIAASFMQDTLVHAEAVRELAASAGAHLKASNVDDALKVMRGCNAWANTLKLTADATHSAIKIAPDNDDNEDLPELIVCVMTDDDVLAERERQREEAINLGIICDETSTDNHADGV